MRLFTKIIIFAIILVVGVLTVNCFVRAEENDNDFDKDPDFGSGDINTTYNEYGDRNKTHAPTDFPVLANQIATVVFGIVGGLAIAAVIYSGIYVMVSADNTEQRKKGYTMLSYSLIGLVVVILAFTIINIVGKGLATLD